MKTPAYSITAILAPYLWDASRLFGPRYLEARRDVLAALTGTRPPASHKAGFNAMMDALYSSYEIPANYCAAERTDRLAEAIRATVPRENLAAAVSQWSDFTLDSQFSRCQPGPLREAIRRETDRRFQHARLEYAGIMADPNGYARQQHALTT